MIKDKFINWALFIALSLIWGSSFLLMKIGLEALKPTQVAALRILSAGIMLLPFFIKSIKAIDNSKIALVFLSGSIGSFIPAFLFCFAETQINSSLTGMLNSLTPLFAVVLGALFFKVKNTWQQIAGVLVGLIGLYFLVFPTGIPILGNLLYVSFILGATLLYAINANMVSDHLKGVTPITIASVAFVLHIIPCLVVLFVSGYFNLSFSNTSVIQSTFAASFLGALGTAFASVLFYRLVIRAGALFSSMVTYGIPFVAAGWGVVYGEKVTILQMGCLAIILSGVYLAKPKSKS